MKKQKAVCRTVAVVEAKHIKPEVMPPLGDIEEPNYNTPGERINYHVGMAQHHGRQALAHLIMAGWELAVQKQNIGYGGWDDWCKSNLDICKSTADRYIQFYQATVGVTRNAAGIPIAKKPTQKELSAATVGMEQKSATRAMVDLEIIKRPKDWGGADRNQGRKPKGETEDVGAALDAVAQNAALLWASAKGALDTLVKLDSKRDVFHRISNESLAIAAGLLADLSQHSADALAKRLDGSHNIIQETSK